MQYLAILGRQPELGLAELESLLGAENLRPFAGHALLAQAPDINQLGGSLKLARIVHTQATAVAAPPLEDLVNLKAGKNVVGISLYGPGASAAKAQAKAMDFKKQLAARHSLRLVLPRAPRSYLGIAQLKFNQLVTRGQEIIIAQDAAGQTIYALTEQAEDIDSYSGRDFGRPARDAEVGMLPPKLAQIMINTAPGGSIFDPFCGTGVVLQEALLMSKAASGSDLSPKMVAATEQNLQWLSDEYPITSPWRVWQADAREVQLPTGSTIVSEGYLGPNLHQAPTAAKLSRLTRELDALYSTALSHWRDSLGIGRSLCLALPAWQANGRYHSLPLIDHLESLGYTLRRFKHVDSTQLIYRRPGQTTGRQLLILRTN